MRKEKDIITDAERGRNLQLLMLETLLDIRSMLKKEIKNKE